MTHLIYMRLAAVLLCIACAVGSVRVAFAQSAEPAVVKQLEQPRFHSLKSDRVNVRRGPGLKHPVTWVFRRVGMPVEVIREFENWWQIRDSEGAQGWVYKGLLARRRTALLVPWKQKDADQGSVALRVKSDASSTVIAFAEPGTIANVRECDGRWCRVIIDPYEGWIEQRQLWGVYEKEAIRP